jgi:hypothetical protein
VSEVSGIKIENVEKSNDYLKKLEIPSGMREAPKPDSIPPWESEPGPLVEPRQRLPTEISEAPVPDFKPSWETAKLDSNPFQNENLPIKGEVPWKSEDGIKLPLKVEPSALTEASDVSEKNRPIKNKEDGLKREADVEKELKEQYPESEGHTIESEVYLRDKDGEIVRDPVTGEARRIDFVVIKDGKVVDSVEVTSKTASKEEQSAKEQRIRESGGNYIIDSNGNLIEIPSEVKTRIERRD